MEIWLLDNNFQAITLIDDYSSFLWVDRYNQCGDFELHTSMGSKWIKDIKKDYYLINTDTDRAMIIENILVQTDAETGSWITISGRSLECMLERRIIWGTRDFEEGSNLQNAIESLLNENVINPSNIKRKIPGVIFKRSTDERITKVTFEGQYTGETIYEVIQKLCNDKQIGFKMVLDTNNNYIFELYVGEDRSYDQTQYQTIVFSPTFDNIINSNYTETDIDYRNASLIEGADKEEGEGEEKKKIKVYASVEDNSTGLNRRELYVSATDISHKRKKEGPVPEGEDEEEEIPDAEYQKLLIERGSEELSKTFKTQLFEGEIEGTLTFKYNKDFFMGDILQVENQYGFQGKSRMTEIIISHSENGMKMYPTFTGINKEGEPIS